MALISLLHRRQLSKSIESLHPAPAKGGNRKDVKPGQVLMHPIYSRKTAGLHYKIIGASLALFVSIFLLQPLTKAEAGQIPAEMIRRTAEALDADLVVSAKSLIARDQKDGKRLFIDVRNARAFEALHIPGAMNIPLHFVKTKAYLKSSPLVLVDQGLSYHRLSPVCRELREMGFDVRILDGGMNAWSSNGGPMEGEPVRQMDYSRILPADFFQESNYATRIVCDVSASLSTVSQRLMPYALHLPLTDNSASHIKKVEEFSSTHARDGATTLLVVNTNGDGYGNIKRAFDLTGFNTVFYLDGGVNAYRKYLDGLSRSWRPREERVVTKSPCGSCADSE